MYEEGDVMKRSTLADTLKQLALAEDPVQLFYNGRFADMIDEEMQSNGKLLANVAHCRWICEQGGSRCLSYKTIRPRSYQRSLLRLVGNVRSATTLLVRRYPVDRLNFS